MISDFGLSKIEDGDGEPMSTACGTPGYVGQCANSSRTVPCMKSDRWDGAHVVNFFFYNFSSRSVEAAAV